MFERTGDLFEAARQEAQRRLDARRSPEERNKLGQYATPPSLARDVVLETLRWRERCPSPEVASSPVHFLDPALGTGAFYGALCESGVKVASAHGVEVDAEVAAMARSLWSHTPLKVSEADFTELAWPSPQAQRANVLVCNPPYVRHHHMSSEQKVRLRELCARHTGIALSGLSGLYVYFMLLADAWWEANGVAAWLIPGELLEVNFGVAVKRYMSTRTTLLRVHRFEPEAVQFDSALVSSTVIWVRKAPAPPGHLVRLTSGPIEAPSMERFVPQEELSPEHKWTRWFSPAGVGRSEGEEAPKLGDVFTIRRGMATGGNKFFILPRQEAQSRGLPESALRPVLPAPRYLKVSEVDSDDDGYPRLSPQLALLDSALSPEVVEATEPGLWRYLQEGVAQGLPARYLCSRRSPWYQQERREPAPFLCTYMGRRRAGSGSAFRWIRNRSQAVATNVYLMLYPKGLLLARLQEEPDWVERLWEALKAIDPVAMQAEGRSYGGGLQKMEPRELRQVPFVWE